MTIDVELSGAISELMAAFESGDLDRYLACFSKDARVHFHTGPRLLLSFENFEGLLKEWVGQGFAVISCKPSNQTVAVHGDTAIYSHKIVTHTRFGGDENISSDFETIVFRRYDSRWLVVYEHLSPVSSDMADQIDTLVGGVDLFGE